MVNKKLFYELAKEVDESGELAYQGLIEMAKGHVSGTLYPCENIAYDIVETFLDTTNKYSIEYFQKFCNQIKVWSYNEFKAHFKTLSNFYEYDTLIDIVSILFQIDCYWASDDYGEDYIICYEYHDIDKKDICTINIIGTYMECERLMTLQEHEILSIKDIENAIECIDIYLNGYLSELSHNLKDDDIYKYADNILDRVDQLIGGLL